MTPNIIKYKIMTPKITKYKIITPKIIKYKIITLNIIKYKISRYSPPMTSPVCPQQKNKTTSNKPDNKKSKLFYTPKQNPLNKTFYTSNNYSPLLPTYSTKHNIYKPTNLALQNICNNKIKQRNTILLGIDTL